MPSSEKIVPSERIDKSILLLRGQKVMLDAALATLYGVSVGRLNEAVKRNCDRFPADFMFQLTRDEFDSLRSQTAAANLKSHIAISSSDWGGRRHPPYAFTEQGVAMLSSVLRSKTAVQVNIEIMRAFVRLREMLASHKDLANKLESLERKFESHDKHIRSLFEAIRQLMASPEPRKRKIGFLVEEKAGVYRRR